MARRRTANAVSLFPFLAVLVCTMGALILLLLVTTRRIRQQQAHESLAQADSSPVISQQVEEQLPVEPVDNSAEIHRLQTIVDTLKNQIKSTTSQIAHRQLELQLLRDLKSDQEARLTEIHSEQQQLQTITSLQGSSTGQSELDEAKERLHLTQQQIESLEQEIELLTKRLAQRQGDLNNVADTSQQAEQLLVRRESALVSLRQLVNQKQTTSVAPSSPETVIEFTNSTGTSREPVIVEVSGKGFTFLPADVKITAQDMLGFRSGDNPLLAGVFAVHSARTTPASDSKPYVLLLVRPSGCTHFYTAQRALKDVDVHFGYDLISEDLTVAAGAKSDTEVRRLRESLLASLTRREQLYGSLLRSGIPHSAVQQDEPKRDRFDAARRILNERILPGSAHDGRFYAGGPPPANRFEKPTPVPEPFERQALADSIVGREEPIEPKATAGIDSSTNSLATENAVARPNTSPDTSKDFNEFWSNLESLNDDSVIDQNSGETSLTTENKAQQPSDWPANEPANIWQESRSVGTARAGKSNETEDVAEFVYSPQWRTRQNPSTESMDDPSRFGIVGATNHGNQKTTMTKAEFSQFVNLLNQQQQQSTPTSLQEVTVFLDENHLTVAQQAAVEINKSSSDELFIQLLQGLREELKHSSAPDSVSVQPVVRFIVSPGAERHRAALALRLNQLQVESSSNVSIDAHVDQERGRVVYSSPQNEQQPQSKSQSMPVIRPRHPEERRRISL